MNTFLKIFLIVAGLIIAILSVVTISRLYVVDKPSQVQPPVTNSSIDIVQQAITVVPDQTFVSGQNTINIEDFMNGGKTFEDPMNPGNYILSGDIGYCLESGFCPNEFSSENYKIWFNGKDGVFFVRLLEQPIRTARLDAEIFLQEALNLSAEQLCDLDYYLSVPEFVSSQFAGQHLKFSACSGSQQL